jgi:Family of unknown function (DUF5681)
MTDTKAGPPNYKVGYGQPPVEHQFKKGQSGNPHGRRKGSVSAASHVAQALNEFVVVQEKGERRSLSKLAVAAKQLVNKAVSGDLRAWKCLLEMMETPEWKRMNETIQQSVDRTSAREILMRRIEQIRARMDATDSRDPDTPGDGFSR